jgi:hypothetical protein
MSQCKPPPPPNNKTDTALLNLCKGNKTTLTASASGKIGWYSEAYGGKYLGGGSSFVTPLLDTTTTFFVQDSSSCAESATRTAITVIVNQPTAYSIIDSFCTEYLLNGQTYSNSGVYKQTFSNAFGCDSILTLTLTKIIPDTFSQKAALCNGQTYKVGSNTYGQSGLYTDRLVGTNGCDSIVITDLTIKTPIDVTTTLSGASIKANLNGATYQWIDCNNGNSTITGEVNQTFVAKVNGKYAVVISVDGCSKTSSCVSVTTIGIFGVDIDQDWFIYPNPNSGLFTVVLSKHVSNSRIEIYNTLGALVYAAKPENEVNTIDLSKEANGLYFVKVVSGNSEMVTQKIIKQ